MKVKLLSVLLCLAMLISFGSMTVLAASQPTIVIEQEGTAAVGNTVSFTLKLTNPGKKGINGVAVQVSVPSGLSYVDSELGKNFLFENYSAAGYLACTVSGDGTVDVNGNTSADLSACGKGVFKEEITLAKVAYKVDSDISGSKITAEVKELFDSEAKDIPLGTATVSKDITTLLAKPTLASVTNVAAGVTVKWNAVEDAVKYRVFYKVAGGSWTKAGDTTSTSYTVTGLTNGTKYTFTVRCLSADGKTYTSKYDTTGKSITYVAAPVVSSVAYKSSSSATVKWGAVSGVSNYSIWRKTGSGGWTKIGTSTGTSYVATGLTTGTKYTFTVRCISESGSNLSGYDSTGKSITLTETPKVSSVSNTASGVQVKWGEVSGATNYTVWYKVSGGSWTKYGTTGGTSLTATGLTSGKTYSFTVRSSDAKGNSCSGYDSKGKTITYVAAPAISSVTANSGSGVTVKWGAVAGAENYVVYYKTAETKWTSAGTTSGTSLSVKNLTAGTKYTFTVRCVAADGKTYTSGYNSTGVSMTYCAAPAVSSVTKTEKGVQVKWGAVSGATNYTVWYKVSGGSWTKGGSTTGTSYTVTGLTSGKTYSFTVRCTDSKGTNTSGFDSKGLSIAY